eukprot:364496-Chlamydomonas_euryale.AAC.47
MENGGIIVLPVEDIVLDMTLKGDATKQRPWRGCRQGHVARHCKDRVSLNVLAPERDRTDKNCWA